MAIQIFKAKYEVEECLEEIRECLEVGWTGLGFKTVQFEDAWKKYTGLENAHFINSSTIGLNMAVAIFKDQYGWNDGDEIITTPITFISTNHAIIKSNLKAVFADIDDSMCLSPASVKEHITDKTRAVMYVGIGGNTGNYKQIVKICQEYNLKLILDAAHMAGTRLDGVIPGKEADVIVYSYQAVKNLPTADSGMICFKEKKFDEIVRKYSWLGISKDTYARSTNSGSYKWKYDVEYVGEKGHGNSIMAAIGIVQLKYLDRDNSYRRQIANWYLRELKDCTKGVKTVRIEDGCESSCHLFQILVDDREGLIEELNKNEIYPGVHYANNIEYQMYDYAEGSCAFAEYVSDHILSLPMNLYLTYYDIQKISHIIKEFIHLH